MSSIYCEFINDNIEASSYVLFSVDSHPDILKVGLVVDIVHFSEVPSSFQSQISNSNETSFAKVLEFLSINELKQLENYNTNTLQQLRGVHEVGLSYLKFKYISGDNIHDIAFVFHEDDFKDNIISGSGISNLFFTRYIVSSDNTLSVISRDEHFAFSYKRPKDCNYYRPCCLSSSVWGLISIIRNKLFSIMCKVSKEQPTYGTRTISIDRKAWNYLLNKCQKNNITLSSVSEKFKRNHHIGLNLHMYKSQRYSVLKTSLLFDNEEKCRFFRSIVGADIGVGIKHRVPRVRDGLQYIPLPNQDEFNLLDFNDFESNEKPFIILSFEDSFTPTLQIKIKFKRALSLSNNEIDAVKDQMVSCISDTFSVHDENDDDIVGESFTYNGCLLEVKENVTQEGTIKCVVIDDPNNNSTTGDEVVINFDAYLAYIN